VFYLGLTKLSEMAFERLTVRLNRGQATTGGDARQGSGA